jgi:hypothetical protein
MNFIDKAMDMWYDFLDRIAPFTDFFGGVMRDVGEVFATIGKFLSKTKKIFLSVPVGWVAVMLAIYNQTNLPAVVGFDLQANGDFGIQIVRELAVFGPLMITGLCILLTVCSKRILTPWLVSVFSLALPVVILVMNTFLI